MFEILQPKLKHRFIVKFYSSDGTELEYGEKLSKQVISTSPITQSNELSKFGIIQNGSSKFSLTVEDDVLNNGCESVQKLYKEQDFTVKILILDGTDKVLRTFNFLNCTVDKIKHGNFDYASRTYDETTMKIKSPIWKLPANTTDDVRDLLDLLSKLELHSTKIGDRPALEKKVYLHYETLSFT